MKYNRLHEVSSAGPQDCFTFLSLGEKQLDGHLHSLDDYELSLILQADGLRFDTGEQAFPFSGPCLVLAAPDLFHAWKTESPAEEITGVIIRFPADLLGDKFLARNPVAGISALLQKAKYGLSFSPEIIEKLSPRIRALEEKTGLESLIALLSLLHELSLAPGAKTICTQVFTPGPGSGNHRIDSVFAYMKANFTRSIFLEDAAKKANMTRGAFCRFIRKRTGKTYVESLNEMRIAHSCRKLVETSENISEIAYQAGFSNIAYFHRSFKKQKGCTPKAYREKWSPTYKMEMLPRALEAS